MKVYRITDITDRGGETRTDGRYPLRIGSTVSFFFPLERNACMLLQYITDNTGAPKEGALRTSRVRAITNRGKELVVTTVNSVYYFEEV